MQKKKRKKLPWTFHKEALPYAIHYSPLEEIGKDFKL